MEQKIKYVDTEDRVKLVISQHKKIKKSSPVRPGFKRVEAVMQSGLTRHLDIPENFN